MAQVINNIMTLLFSFFVCGSGLQSLWKWWWTPG